jgi:hypothetical protein
MWSLLLKTWALNIFSSLKTGSVLRVVNLDSTLSPLRSSIFIWRSMMSIKWKVMLWTVLSSKPNSFLNHSLSSVFLFYSESCLLFRLLIDSSLKLHLVRMMPKLLQTYFSPKESMKTLSVDYREASILGLELSIHIRS